MTGNLRKITIIFSIYQGKKVIHGKKIAHINSKNLLHNLIRKRSTEEELFHCMVFNPLPDDKFKTLPNSKSWQTTISNSMKMAVSSLRG